LRQIQQTLVVMNPSRSRTNTVSSVAAAERLVCLKEVYRLFRGRAIMNRTEIS